MIVSEYIKNVKIFLYFISIFFVLYFKVYVWKISKEYVWFHQEQSNVLQYFDNVKHN